VPELALINRLFTGFDLRAAYRERVASAAFHFAKDVPEFLQDAVNVLGKTKRIFPAVRVTRRE
jgi:hypothetical protein